MTVLLVDDHESITRLWREYLAPVGAEFRVAATLQEALLQMRKIPPPDLVILDLCLPGSSPENTLLHIKELKSINNEAVVVVLTGCPDESLPALAAKFGSDAFYMKLEVASQKALLSAVRSALSNRVESKQPVFERNLEVLEQLTALVTGSSNGGIGANP